MSAPQDYSIFQCVCAYALMNRKKLIWWAYHKTAFPVASRGHELKGAILRATKVSGILKGKSCHRWLWSGDVKEHLTNFGGGNSWFCTSLSSCTPWSSLFWQVQDKILCSACNAISHQLWTCNLSGEELDYYLKTSFICLQAAAFKLFDLNFALITIKILQNMHLLPHVQQGTPTKFVRG
jgi:hypothetical protein